jgi:UDP-N-acetylmuramate: L-alanyl-gamma-D-glutamyl-meso-diaminopimelate ligase
MFNPGENVRHVHFLGICGTAMGAVAAAMRENGFSVSGQDENVYPPMSVYLADRGIEISAGYHPAEIPRQTDLVVVGNAMTRGNPCVEAVLNRKLAYLSLPETLKFFFLRGRHNLVVTGTHGKTTTTSMLTWIFESSGRKPGWLIGGVPANLPGGANLRPSKYFVIEGDEYDTAFFDKRSKFLHYLPELVILNNIEFDHADIYRDIEDIKLTFRRLLAVVPSGGMVLVNADDPHTVEVAANCPAPVLEVGFSQNAGQCIRNTSHHARGSKFEILGECFEIPLIGDFNVRNAAMAACAAHFYGIPLPEIRAALTQFAGIKRRQEVRGCKAGITIIDDFGHHPTAIRETLAALHAKYAGARIWALFEPRSNTTRRNVFQLELPKAFAAAHGVALAPVARLEQIPPEDRLDPARVINDITASGRPAFYAPATESLLDWLLPQLEAGDVVVAFSNGSFDGIHDKLLSRLTPNPTH